MSSMISPIEAVCPFRSSRALSLRRKPRSLIALRTRLAVSGVTPGSSLTTRDTVLSATPARVATSFMVGRPRPFRRTGPPGPLGPAAPLAPSGTCGPREPAAGAAQARRLTWLARYAMRPVKGTPVKIADHGCFPCSSRRVRERWAGRLLLRRNTPCLPRDPCRRVRQFPRGRGVRCRAFRRACPGRGSPQRQVCYKRGGTANTTLSFLAGIWFPAEKDIVVHALVFGKSGFAW